MGRRPQPPHPVMRRVSDHAGHLQRPCKHLECLDAEAALVVGMVPFAQSSKPLRGVPGDWAQLGCHKKAYLVEATCSLAAGRVRSESCSNATSVVAAAYSRPGSASGS